MLNRTSDTGIHFTAAIGAPPVMNWFLIRLFFPRFQGVPIEPVQHGVKRPAEEHITETKAVIKT